MLFKEIQILVKKDLLLELRQKYALNGMLLYVGSTILICYLSFNLRGAQLQAVTWNALFWIIMLFAAVNAIAKSFMQEREGRYLYYYSLVSAQGIILSKIIYNTFLMILLAVLGISIYSLVLGNPVQDMILFGLTILLGAASFASTLTMISSIAAKAGNNSTLMAVLSFPVIVPMLLMLIKISKNAIDGLPRSNSWDEIIVLLAINVIVVTISFILFPFLWRS